MSRQEEKFETNGPEPIDLIPIIQDFFRILRGRWIYLLLTMAVLGAGLTFWRYHSYSPYYTASATYAITTYQGGNSSTYQDNSLTHQMAETAPYVLGSDMFQRRVAEALGSGSVPGSIRASVMENTNFLTISVSHSSPQTAYETLKAVQQVFPDVSKQIIGNFYMEPMDESGVPSAPTNPRTPKADLVQGVLLGLLLGAVVIGVSAFTNATVRREEDCIKRINTKCLGVVPRIRQKVRSRQTEQHLNILRKNADPDLVEAFRGLRNKIERRADKKGCRTLLITSALPGEGKSTIAVNTVLSLAQAGKRVVLVDCDLRNPTDDIILEAPEGPGLVDFLTGKETLSRCLLSGEDLFGYSLPMYFLRGGKAVADGSGYLPTGAMKQLIQFFETQVDYLILDTPPAGLLTDAGILSQYADGILFVVKEDFAKVDKILEGMEHVSQGGCEMLGCILNDDH